MLPTCPFIAPASCCIASCRPLVALPLLSSHCASWLSHCLSLSSWCATLQSSCCTSWFLHRLLLSSCCATLSPSHHAGWLLRHLLMHHPLILLLRCPLILSGCQLISVLPLIVLLMHLRIVHCLSLRHPIVLSLRRIVVELSLLAPPSCPLVMLPSHRAGWLLRCLRQTLPLPSNAIECHCHHRHRPHRHCRCCCRPPPLPPHHCSLPKKEAAAAPAPVRQRQHQRENIYKSRQLGLILTFIIEVD
jgi:hypothetical protein